MQQNSFVPSVTVLVGLGFPHRITNPLEALGFLDTVPVLQRDEAYHATRQACGEALEGTTRIDEARDVLCALARRRGILLENDWPDVSVAEDQSTWINSSW